jgi:hypothetical protein
VFSIIFCNRASHVVFFCLNKMTWTGVCIDKRKCSCSQRQTTFLALYHLRALVPRNREMHPSERFGISRRTALIVAGATPLAAMIANRARGATKVSQSAVHYQPSPKDGKDCDDCANFLSPSACKLVDGNISPKGWCRLFVKKAS